MELHEFMQLEPPGFRPSSGSKLDPLGADIRELVRTGRTRAQIQRYLKAKGVSSSIQTISSWLRKHKLRTENQQTVETVNARRAATRAARASGAVSE